MPRKKKEEVAEEAIANNETPDTVENVQEDDQMLDNLETSADDISTEDFDDSEFESEPVNAEAEEDVVHITEDTDDDEDNASPPAPTRVPAGRSGRVRRETVLTVNVGDKVESDKSKENTIWHELKNSQVRNKILTGTLSQIERTELGSMMCIVDFMGQRVVVPLKEMAISLNRPDGQSDAEYTSRVERVLNRLLGAEIDFIVRGLENFGGQRAAVASRKAAMLKKRERYYLNLREDGLPVVRPGISAMARIVSVGMRFVRVEIFGVEHTINYNDISWDYIGDVRDHYYVGDTVKVKVSDVVGTNVNDLRVYADIKSLHADKTTEKLKTMKVQSVCMGTITDIRDGVIFVRLLNGVMAVCHECLKRRQPGSGDKVALTVRRIDLDRRSVSGVISRINKRNI